MADAKSKEPVEAAPAKKGSGRRRLLVIGGAVALVAIAGGGAGAWYFLAGGNATEAAPAQAQGRKGPPQYLPIDTLTVNIQGGEGDHYLQLGVTLQTTDAKTSDRIKQYLPVIRNALLLLVSAKKADELKTHDGKAQLQKEILAAARAPLPGDGPEKGVDGVLFSSFVIQ